jgi:glycogen debranching enzyme
VASPFKIVDPGFNAILLRSCQDIAWLAEQLGETDIARRNNCFAGRGIDALEKLWDERHGQYVCFDRAAGKLVDSASVGGILPAFAAIPMKRVRSLSKRIDDLASRTRYLVASHDPADPRFDAKRYWRGPCWLIVNTMIADGLKAAGHTEQATRIRRSSLELIDRSGFAEYYDPLTGEALGGGSFTWTAAMVLELLRDQG